MSIEDAISGAMAEARDEGIIEDLATGDTGDGVEVQAEAEGTGDPEVVVDPATKVADTTEADAEAVAKVAADKAETEARATAEKNKGKTPEEILKEELGPDKNERGKENKIPHSRVVKIVDNQVTARMAPVAAALGLEAKDFSIEKVVARLSEATTLQAEVTNNRNVEHMMDFNPEKFIRTLAAHHPGYKRFVDFLDGVVATPAAKAGPAAVVIPAGDPEPEPDLPIRDDAGAEIGRTYSLAGLKKRDDWRDRQTEARIFANPKLKGVLDRDEAQARITAAEPGLRAQMNDARTWEGFSDSEQEILAVLVADSTQAQTSGKYMHDLNSAYRKVVLPKLKAAREKAEKDAKDAEALGRKKALAEVKKRPASTSAPAAGGRAEESTGPKDLADVIREQVAALKGGRA